MQVASPRYTISSARSQQKLFARHQAMRMASVIKDQHLYIGIPLPQLPPLPFDISKHDQIFHTSHGSQPSLSLLKTSSSTKTLVTRAVGETTTSDHGKLCSKSILPQPIRHSTIDVPADHEEVNKRPRNWFRRWFVDWWMTEIVSWFFGVTCMIIIATVLSKYDGKPDPRWKIGISIGSFISIFSGFAKSALLLPTAEGN